MLYVSSKLANMKFLIMNEPLGNKVLDTQPIDKQTMHLEVSLLFKIPKDSVRLSKFDSNFQEYVTLDTDSHFASLNDMEKLRLDVSEPPKVLADFSVPIPQEGGAVNLPLAIVPSSDAEDTDGDSSFNTSNLSTSTGMNDR